MGVGCTGCIAEAEALSWSGKSGGGQDIVGGRGNAAGMALADVVPERESGRAENLGENRGLYLT